MSESSLALALELPRAARESPINVGHLYILFLICKKGLDRYQVVDSVVHKKPTIDKRLAYLVSKQLISPEVAEHYHDRRAYRSTVLGTKLYDLFRQGKSHRALMEALENAANLPVKKREEPINVGHLHVLNLIHREPRIETASLVVYCNNSKPTIRSRCQFLERKGLIEKYPRFNGGGNGSPNHYIASQAGSALVKSLFYSAAA